MINYYTLLNHTNTIGDWLLAVLIVLCVMAHLACLRSPDVQEVMVKEMGRRIKIAGFIIISINWWVKLFHGDDILVSTPSVIGLALLFFGELLITTLRLYEHRYDFIPEKYLGRERRKPVVTKVMTTVTVLDPSRVDATSTIIMPEAKDAP